MRCPRCSYPLAQQRSVNVVIDVCQRCKGTFLESGEARAIIGENADPETWERTSHARFLGKTSLECPKGHGRLSGFRLEAPSGSGAHVEVDVCPSCMGMWLDAWEAQRLADATRAMRRPATPSPDPPLVQGEQRVGAGWYLFQLFSGLPVEEYNPMRRRPVVVYGLMLACLAVFLVELSAADPNAFVLAFGAVPASIMKGGQPWAWVTHMFLHGSWPHLIGNMYFLYTFGDNIEDRVGRSRFLVLYLVFGLCAGAAQVLMSLGSPVPLVGASGAIAGLMGAYVVMFPKTKLYWVFLFIRFRIPAALYLVVWMLYQAMLGFADIAMGHGSGVAWWAHVGGFAAGALWAIFGRNTYGERALARGPSAT
jgi:membrane associated rhomboid family serine protease